MIRKIQVSVLMLLMIVMMAGCANTRKVVEIDKFMSVCTIEKMKEIPLSDMAPSFDGIKESYAAKLTGNDFQAYYIRFDSEDFCLAAYDEVYASLDPGVTGTEINLEGENYHSIVIDSDAAYIRLIQVDDMLIKICGSQAYKTAIDKFASQFGNYPTSAV